MANPTHIANTVHPKYHHDRNARALSLAFKEGTPAFRRDAGRARGQRRWVRPAAGELENVHSVDYKAGMAVFDVRKQLYRTSNHYADCLRTAATQTLDYLPILTGWDRSIEARLNGVGIGLDGAGASMREMHAQAFSDKLFAGIHYIRIDVADGVPIWRHTAADDLLNWRVNFTSSGLVLSSANVQITSDTGDILRTIYNLESGGVSWVTYQAEKSGGLVLSQDVYEQQHEWNEIDRGNMARLPSVPIEPFAMNWQIPYRSPVPLADAAEIQLAADAHESMLAAYRQRASSSPAFVISEGDSTVHSGGPGYGSKKTDENAQPRPVRQAGGAILLQSDQARGRWESLDTRHIEQEWAVIEKEHEQVRRKCQDPLRATFKGGPITATQAIVEDTRGMSWLRLATLMDVRPLRRLTGYTALMSGSSPEGEIEIRLARSSRERTELVDRVQEQAEKGLLSRRVLWKVAADNVEGYPTPEEIEELSRDDNEEEEDTTNNN